MGSNRDNAQEDADQALDRQIRSHFATARQNVPVPEFDAVMGKLEAEGAGAARASSSGWLSELTSAPWPVWAGTAVAAALVIAVLLAIGDRQGSRIQDDVMLAQLPAAMAVSEQELIADLNRSTRWQAPSDRWPSAEADLDILGVPDLGDLSEATEESIWL